MTVKKGWRTILLMFLLAVVALQVGCGVSEDAGGPNPDPDDNDIRLALSTPNGVNTIVADGQDSLPISIAVTTRAGVGRAGVQVTFTTTNGTLAAAPAVPAARADAQEGGVVTRQDEGETVTLTTDADGIAEVILTSSTTAGSALLSAAIPPQGGNNDGFRTSLTVFFVFPVAEVTLRANPSTVVRDTTSVIEATLLDDDGDPVANERVTFTIVTNRSGAVLSATTATTGTTGRASVNYTAGSNIGVDVVEARTGNGTFETAEVTVVQPSVANITLALVGNADIVADGASTVGLRVSVFDSDNTGIPGIIVTFTTSAGALSALTATTDTDGIARVNLISSTVIGTATVTATADGFTSNSVSALFIAGPPSAVTLTADPNPVSIDEQATITATVVDFNNNPVSNTTLTLSIRPNASGGSLATATGSTDASGRLSTVYTAGGTPGTDTIRVLTTNSVTQTLDITVNEGDPPIGDVAAITIVRGAETLVADGTSTVGIRATVTDADGVGLPGVPITFTTTAGSLAATTVTSNDQGVARVNLIAATNLGTATITAAAEGFRASTTVRFVAGAPALVRLTPALSIVNTGEDSAIVVSVFDTNDNPVAATTLTLSLPTNVSGATLDVLSGDTDSNGRFTVTYTAGNTPGTDTVQAETTNNIIGTVSIRITPLAVAGRIDLLVSSPQLDSDNSETVTLTALVRDTNNNAVPNVRVAFAATSGLIVIQRDMTDVSGTATALLTTGGDPENRGITVTATTASLASTNTVTVTGTTITLSGAGSVVLGEDRTISILLRNSGGTGIANEEVTLTSARGNPLSASSIITDTNGQGTVTVTATIPEADTITATALNATAVFPLNVSAANFVFTVPAADVQVPLGTTQNVVIHWDENGTNQTGETINFFATRGSLSATSAVTDADGNASVTISSVNAGPAVITAVSTRPSGPSSQVEIVFVATTARSLILQANPTTLGVNLDGASDQQSIITAVVRDADGNLAQNQEIRFTLNDISGGRISPSSAITDSFGRASTVYTSGNVSSAQDGVIIDAEVIGTVACDPTEAVPSGPCDRVTLTVAQQALFITLGTGNLITPLDATRYAQPYSVLVTDANGNPVASARVELNLYATRYQKGFYTLVFDVLGNCIGWGKELTINQDNGGDDVDQACNNEDVNRNGILNPGEDANDNTILDPGQVATVPTAVTTDAEGFAVFNVIYAREFTWGEVQLEARATVAGSEAFTRVTYFLPGLADDFNDCTVAPPGVISPFGLATTCTCDDRSDETCPTRSGITPVILTPSSTTLFKERGGTVTFTPIGGSETSYTISSNGGTLSTNIVNFGDSFILEIEPILEPGVITITVTVTDSSTSQTGTASVFLVDSPAVNIVPTNRTLTAEGGTITYTVTGGTETDYTITTSLGTLRNADGTQVGETIIVEERENFTLEVPPNQASVNVNITVFAADNETGAEGRASVVLLALQTVSLVPNTATVLNTGGIVLFTAVGGSQTSYTAATDVGTLTNTTSGATGSTITAGFGEDFFLNVPLNPADTFRTITVVARDNNSPAPEGRATVTQQPSPNLVVSPSSFTLPVGGGTTSAFTVSGGSGGPYTVETSSGSLRNLTTLEEGSTISVASTEGFVLTTTTTALITATDTGGLQDNVSITVQVPLPVVLTPAGFTLPPGGGTTDPFTLSGGAGNTFTVQTTSGNLRNLTTGATGATITVLSTESFTLTTEASATVTAIDNASNLLDTASVTVQLP